jgi:hypothetical protein
MGATFFYAVYGEKLAASDDQKIIDNLSDLRK